ncbi:hypothetical protein DQ04_07531020 [Trypanosoma grayi]|uniref:hypothetical protein n=1 Tax=Trypanosoma grayi TaxID=71804 RepID=UPI0004F4059B|nr:hypothetical protein DQ04_07531020 [Trypanosoma grayi]KEG08283.1 hypothetical protein DQ04_07531020 [Trypanosoma grayi]
MCPLYIPFWLIILLLLTQLVSAQDTYAILKFVTETSVPCVTAASKRGDQAGMRLAVPDTLGVAVTMGESSPHDALVCSFCLAGMGCVVTTPFRCSIFRLL